MFSMEATGTNTRRGHAVDGAHHDAGKRFDLCSQLTAPRRFQTKICIAASKASCPGKATRSRLQTASKKVQ